MLKRLHIQNCKLFKSFAVEDIPRILLIGGKNNCGKTSFLEAAFFILDCKNPDMFMRHFSWREAVFQNTAESLFAPFFHNFDLKSPMTFEYTIKSSKKKLQYRRLLPETSFLSAKNGGAGGGENKSGVQTSLSDNPGGIEISYWKDMAAKKPPKALLKLNAKGLNLSSFKQMKNYNEGVEALFLSSAPAPMEENAERYGALDKISQTEDILKALQILEPDLKSLSIIPIGGMPVIYGDTGIGQKIPLSLMGQGLDRLISILLGISAVKNGVVLIDEMENGFHHSVFPRIWKAIASYAEAKGAQIIATTHSRELAAGAVEGIPPGMKKEFKYIRIDRGKDSIKHGSYDMETLRTALESNYAIR